jgi:hypothetical protein
MINERIGCVIKAIMMVIRAAITRGVTMLSYPLLKCCFFGLVCSVIDQWLFTMLYAPALALNLSC